MIDLDLALEDGSTRLPLRTGRATKFEIATGAHGLESIGLELPLTLYQTFDLYRRLSADLRAVATGAGAAIASGRCEDISIENEGASIEALGDWRAFSDLPYTALWSVSTVDDWRPITPQELATRDSALWLMDNNNRLLISLKKGITYPNNTRLGGYVYELPDGGSRGAVGLQLTIAYNLPAGFNFGVVIYNAAWGGLATSFSLTPGAGAASRAWHITFASAQKVELFLRNNSGVTYTNAQEDGDFYIRATSVRIVSDTTNRINTTLTANVTAGASKSCTVGSTSGMYVGQELVFDSGNALSEIAVVSSITSGTVVVVATLVNAHNIGQAVQAHRVLADAIAKDMRDAVVAVNAGALSSSNSLIQSPGLDLLDVVYEDADMAEELNDLAEQGDGTQLWETGVVEGGLLYLRPQGDAAQTWYIVAGSIDAQQTLTQLVNSAYAVYKSASGRALRTSPAGNATSVTRYGLTRRKAVKASTTNATIAAQVANNEVIAAADPIPQSSVAFDRVYTASGAVAPLWMVKAGDTFVLRNLASNNDPLIDKLRSFRLARTTYDVLADVLKVVPESPLPELEYQLAQALPPL